MLDLWGEEVIEEDIFDEKGWSDNYKKRNNVYTPFDFGNDLSFTKKNILKLEGHSEEVVKNLKGCVFMINRIFSQYQDTVLWANEMNVANGLDPDMVYEFYFTGIKSRKRFAKWGKSKKIKDIEIVMEYYKYSRRMASTIIDLVSQDDLDMMKRKLNKGGTGKSNIT